MASISAVPQPETQPGIASAEDGLVVLDGPDGLALTMTPDAAAQTGQSLLDAAAIAIQQQGLANGDNASDHQEEA